MDRREAEELIASLGGRKKILEDFARFERDTVFVADHYAQLLKEHPEQYVAVFEGKLVAVASDLRELMRLIEEAHVPRGQVVIEFLTARPMRLQLLEVE